MRALLIVFALLWLVLVGAFVWWRNPAAVAAMSPSEWGEFLAGVFGPLGFLAVLFTLIQQGADLKHQREQIEKQLSTLQEQMKAQVSQADAARAQVTLAVERLQIERIRGRVNSLAMTAVRYADRMKISNSAEPIFLIGSKSELREDLKLGPEAVLETVRESLKANVKRIKAEKFAIADLDVRNRVGSLTKNLLQRLEDMNKALTSSPTLPEIDQLKLDLQLQSTKDRMVEAREALELVSPA